jgi:translation initiation factor IF-2
MAEVTVNQFAKVLKVPVDRLLVQLGEAGIKVSNADDTISEDAKLELLSHLRKSHGAGDSGTAAAPKKITLKRKSQSELRLAGNQGRSRTVNVEVRSKRTYIKRDVLEEEARKQQEELDSKRQEEEDARLAVEREEQARKDAQDRELADRQQAVADEEARKVAEEDAQRQAVDDEARRRAADEAKEKSNQERERKRQEADRNRKSAPAKTLHVSTNMSGRRRKKKPSRRRNVQVSGDSKHGFERPTEPVIRDVEIPNTITVSELANRMATKSTEVIRALMNMGLMVTINQVIDQDTAVLVVEELGHTAKPLEESFLEDKILEAATTNTTSSSAVDEVGRAPVVTVMGHVDHGKTSLLDYIRTSRVASGEAGGITQHIGAYSVTTDKGRVAFIDTPGHSAFTAMRARGAQVTDLVILVVAADDGVMPQTVEAVKHARAAGVPIVVAVNKMDREDADPERVRNELSQHEVISEQWGGDTLFVNVSAITGEGVDDLLDAILLQSELLDLKAQAAGPATGVVLEASLERGRGAVATVLVKGGELSLGDMMLAGHEYGRVRAMFDEDGKPVQKVGPSTPVAVLGLSNVPAAGDDVLVVTDERKAREVAELRQGRDRDVKLAQQQATKLEDVFSKMGDSASVQLLIKADVHGSSEALRESLERLSGDEVEVKVVSSGVGGITESDVHLAAASDAIILGFNVRADSSARTALKDAGVDVRYYSIIYEAIDDVKAAVSGLLSPEIREQILGLAEVKEVFHSPKFGDIAGCIVADGHVKRSSPIRVLRDNVVIYEGELESLRRFKDDVNEVRAGTECGIGVKNYSDVRAGDQIECFERTEVARTL